MNLLEMQHVKKDFGENEVLKDISLSVAEGEVVSIIGPSGSGKSTLLRCATLLEQMDDGSLTYMGEKAAESINGKTVYAKPADLKKIQRHFGLVFQNFNLFPHYSVMKNITDAPIRIQKRNKDEVFKEARELLAKMGLSDKENAYPCQLSGGQCQRVAIARALAQTPKLLICDEATSAVDVSVQAPIMELLIRIRKEKNLSILFISHDLALVSSFCDRIYVLNHGKVVESGETAQIIHAPQQPYTKKLIASLLTV